MLGLKLNHVSKRGQWYCVQTAVIREMDKFIYKVNTRNTNYTLRQK